MNFNVTVQVKPYVKRFLENNYGDPVNFNCHPREKEMFKRMLKKPNNDNDHKYPKEFFLHSNTVEILISDHDFYRHGWEVSKTDAISFGKYFERNVKLLMRLVVGTYISFGMPINAAIERFQCRFCMDDEYWPFDSIQKDFFRYKKYHNIEFNQFAFQHLERLILSNMSNMGAITSSIIRQHELKIVSSI